MASHGRKMTQNRSILVVWKSFVFSFRKSSPGGWSGAHCEFQKRFAYKRGSFSVLVRLWRCRSTPRPKKSRTFRFSLLEVSKITATRFFGSFLATKVQMAHDIVCGTSPPVLGPAWGCFGVDVGTFSVIF